MSENDSLVTESEFEFENATERNISEMGEVRKLRSFNYLGGIGSQINIKNVLGDKDESPREDSYSTTKNNQIPK